MQSPDLVDRAILPWDSEASDGYPPVQYAKLLVVQGDTRTAFQWAVIAYEQGIPVFHLEAGVRTYDLSSPWPEEGYRQMISRIATYHACTTANGMTNLLDEGLFGGWGPYDENKIRTAGVSTDTCRVTGSPIVESVRERAETPCAMTSYVLLTLHRRENRGHFRDIVAGVIDAVGTMSVAWYSHPNGWAAQEAGELLIPSPPLDATAFAASLARTRLVVTDSGGVQEECNALGVPCVVAREKTDRPESLGKGGAILAGTTRKGVRNAILQHALKMDRSTIDRTIFGDGTASEKIVSWWAELLA